MVRDGSSAMDMEGLFDLDSASDLIDNPEKLGIVFRDIFQKGIYSPMFDFIVSDDKHPDDLIKGHLNLSIKKAVSLGIDILKAISMVTINPARHYNLNCGAIVEGAKADYVIIDSMYDFNILKHILAGNVSLTEKMFYLMFLKLKLKIQLMPLKNPPVILTYSMKGMSVKSTLSNALTVICLLKKPLQNCALKMALYSQIPMRIF